MKKLLCILTISLGTLLEIACAHTMTLRTQPTEATVYQIDPAGKRLRTLGKSPVQLANLDAADILGLEIVAPGYEKRIIYLPVWLKTQLEITVSLSPANAGLVIESYGQAINSALEDLIELQTLMVSDDRDVEKRIEALKKSYDKLPIFHTMQGAYWYTKKNFEKSVSAYRRAIVLDPENREARSILTILGEKIPGPKAASSRAPRPAAAAKGEGG